MDAAFKRDTGLSKPSSLLLHYNDGAVAVRLWGQHASHFLTDAFRKNIPRPSRTVDHQSSTRPTSRHERGDVIAKRDHHRDATSGSRGAGNSAADANMSTQDRQKVQASAGNHAVMPINGSSGWDEHDWMILFWSNTKAALERRHAIEEEFPSRINKWIGEVGS